MKIAIITDAWYPQVSGVVTTLTKTINILQNIGHNVLCIHPGLFSPLLPCPTYPQIKFVLHPGKCFSRMLDDFTPDLIHAVTEGPLGFACRSYCRKRNLNFSTSFSTRFDYYINLRFKIPCVWTLKLMRWYHSASSCLMVSTTKLKEELQEEGFSHLSIWPRGVDTELFCPRDKDFIKDKRPIFIYLGRVAVEKNIKDFLNLNLKGTKYVIGDGPSLDSMQNKYPQARFVGCKTGKTLAKYLAAGDALVFPSKTDTFGLVMLEAMACGLPVAAYPVQGPLDIVKEGVTGYLDNNLERAAVKATRLSAQDCRSYAENFSWEKAIEQFFSNLVRCC